MSANAPADTDVTELEITGMHCAACVNRVERAIGSAPGVVEASVNLLEHRAQVRFDPQAFRLDEVREAVERAGYEADLARPTDAPDEADAGAHDRVARSTVWRLVLGVALTIPIVLIGHGEMLIPGFGDLDPLVRRRLDLLAGLLAVPVVTVVGGGYFRRAWKAFRVRQATMDTLVALGTGAAFVYSWLAVAAPGLFPGGTAQSFFEAAAVVITLVLLGQVLEARAKGRTSRAVRALLDLAPAKATVVRDGVEIEIPAEDIVPGELVVLRPGERVPVDGTVVEGESAIDEALMTGESIPVSKAAGDPVVSGTVNTTGSLRFRAERVGADTVLARVVDLVRQAQTSKPPIQRMADLIAHYFVPSVMIVAVTAFAVWYVVGPDPRLNYAVVVAAAVLLISCPCALGLATPISVMIGIGKAAEHGVLIRSGEALERARSVDTVVMDKTGTLTMGEPAVTSVASLAADRSDTEVLRLAAAVEAGSEHPLGRAVIREAERQTLSPAGATEFQARPGHGVRAVVEGRVVLVGTSRFLESAGIPTAVAADRVADLAERGQTAVLVAEEDRVVGVIGLSDRARPEAAEVVGALQADGKEVIMLTGDSEATARAVAEGLGIDRVVAGVLPEGKTEVISELQREGRTVAMVGDGVNDAPALARADVGVALGAGTDVAVEAADVTLMSDSLRGVITALDVSRATFRNILQNLGGAFIYNVLGIPVAAGVLYPAFGLLLSPMLAGAAMAFSSVTVVTNANRLRGYRPPHHDR